MIILPSRDVVSISEIVEAMQHARVLTPEEAKLLRIEIDSDPEHRGYAKQDDASLLALLCLPFATPNPQAQGRVPKPVLAGTLRSALALEKNSNLDVLLSVVAPDLNLTDAGIVDKIGGSIGVGSKEGLVTEEEWAALTTDPDPTWEAEWQMDPRASSVLDVRYVLLDLDDVKAIRG